MLRIEHIYEIQCNTISLPQIWFNAVAWAHQLGAFAYDLPEYDEQYHLHSMAVWGIIGVVLGWLVSLTSLKD